MLEMGGCASASERLGFGSAVDIELGLVHRSCPAVAALAVCSAGWMFLALTGMTRALLPDWCCVVPQCACAKLVRWHAWVPQPAWHTVY